MDDTPPMIDATPVTNHLYTHLGKVEEAWSLTEDTTASPFWLVRYERVPEYNWVIIGTYGLSRTPLYQEEGMPVRQELLVCCPKDQVTVALLAHIEALATAMLDNEEALGLGETLDIALEPKLSSGSQEAWAGWFITLPFFIADHGFMCADLDAPLILTWAIPVYESEKLFIAEKGSDAFNNILLAKRNETFSWPRPKLAHSLYTD